MATSYILTNQKIPDSEKTKEWHMAHIQNFVTFDVKRTVSERREMQKKCWMYYLCINDTEKQKANQPITQPYGFNLGLEWMQYPLVETKIEQFVGEFITRGIKKKTYVLNKAAKTKKLDDAYNLISEEILREVNRELEPALGFIPETENPEKQLPEDVETFLESDYKTVSEQVSDTILDQVIVAKKQGEKIKQLFLDFLLFDECIAEVDEKDGSPSIERLSIFETEMDFNSEKEVEDNPQYVITNRVLNYNQIINAYNLTNEEECILKTYLTANMRNTADASVTTGSGFDNGISYTDWLSGEGALLLIRCVEMKWISQKRIRVKVSINKRTGKEIYKNLPDKYKARKSDNIKTIWVQEKRFCFMVGPDLVLDWGVDKQRFSRIDDPKKDSLPVVAIRRNNQINGNNLRSAASKLLQLQDFASENLFELRLAMRRNAGRVLVYDAAQIPKQFLKTGGYGNAINRVMHHVKKDQFLIINSQDKQARYNFNQFTSLDMSTKGLMMDLFNTLALIEDLADKFIGMSKQQQGQISQYESATGTERAVAQTTARQEVYISPFESFLKFLFDKILLKGKYVYEENETAEYIFGDLKTKFFKVYPEYFQEDTGTYIADSYSEKRKKNTIDRAAEVALGSAQNTDLMLNLIETLNADTASESIAIFKKGLKALDALRAQQQEADARNAQMQAQATQEAAQREDIRASDKNQNNIDVANIYADNKAITDGARNDTQKVIKLAEIEKDFLLAQEKNNKN